MGIFRKQTARAPLTTVLLVLLLALSCSTNISSDNPSSLVTLTVKYNVVLFCGISLRIVRLPDVLVGLAEALM